MPKLKDHDVERNQVRIQDAALRIFTRQGYHGTSVREIAEQAGVSLGNIYNYYRTKEEIFEALVRRYADNMVQLQLQKLVPVLGSFDAASLRRLADTVREIVTENPDYWRLMYIDVVEFGNKHFRHIFQDFPAALRRMKPEGFRAPSVRTGVDPAVAYASLYLQFFLYYLIETLFGGDNHLGVPEAQAISHFIDVFSAGTARTNTAPARGTTKREARSGRKSLKTGGNKHAQTVPGPAVLRANAGTRRSR